VNFVHEYPRHSHSTWAIGVVDDGTGGIWYRGTDERGGPGELITISRGEAHTGYPLQRCGISYSMLYVGDELVKEILPQSTNLPAFSRVTVPDPQLPIRLRRLCRALESGSPSLALETHLFSELAYVFREHGRAKAPEWTGHEPGHVTRMKEYLRANACRNARLSELANRTGLSKAYAIRSFRRRVGMPPYKWLLQLRIEQARIRLRKGEAISNLAIELGFSDQSHFHRRFQRLTGMTAAGYAEGRYRSRQDHPAQRG
jgi:AraC-like DNA-binding protein